jgi:hypothetical protein
VGLIDRGEEPVRGVEAETESANCVIPRLHPHSDGLSGGRGMTAV